MEKFVYMIGPSEQVSLDDLAQTLLSTAVAELRERGASKITINIADMNEDFQAEAPGRLIGCWQDVQAVVSFWHDCLDHRAPIETYLASLAGPLTGYLVTESVLQAFDPVWEGGDRRPGVTQFGANAKPANVSDEDFYHNWQVDHSSLSFDLHPLRWSYVRDAVARPLTPNAPPYRAIVAEHFKQLEDFTDDSRYFGSAEVVQAMIAEIPGFCDVNAMFSVPMSEYFFK
jgi:hypothetical protein